MTLAEVMRRARRYELNERRKSQQLARACVVQPVVNALGLEKSISVLDLGCGAGSWSLELACRRNRVVAVDRRPAALDWVQAEAARMGVEVECIEADFATLTLARTFDLVIQIFTGVLSLAPLSRAVAKNGRALWQESRFPNVDTVRASGFRIERQLAAPRGLVVLRRDFRDHL